MDKLLSVFFSDYFMLIIFVSFFVFSLNDQNFRTNAGIPRKKIAKFVRYMSLIGIAIYLLKIFIRSF